MREEKIVDVGPICDGDRVDPMREAVLHNHVVIANNVSQIVVDIILHKRSRDALFRQQGLFIFLALCNI